MLNEELKSILKSYFLNEITRFPSYEMGKEEEGKEELKKRRVEKSLYLFIKVNMKQSAVVAFQQMFICVHMKFVEHLCRPFVDNSLFHFVNSFAEIVFSLQYRSTFVTFI